MLMGLFKPIPPFFLNKDGVTLNISAKIMQIIQYILTIKYITQI